MRTILCAEEQVFSGPLIVVNRSSPLRRDGGVQLLPVDAGRGVWMERRAALLLQDCIRSVGGEHEIVPVSGWRSGAEQQAIWEQSMEAHGEAFTRSYVALPGCSEHQTGLAVDLGKEAPEIDWIRPAFPEEGICGAFRHAAARYGFIERYSEEKQGLTGIAWEPWHFRYVGVPHAQLMREHGLCLEEYAGFLQHGPRHCRLPGRRTVQVSYVRCAGRQTVIEAPEGCCQISGDNQAGFFVTFWGNAG